LSDDKKGRSVYSATKDHIHALRQNTQLTETVKALTERVEALTLDVHKTVVNSRSA
jgi:hypothetical protein